MAENNIARDGRFAEREYKQFILDTAKALQQGFKHDPSGSPYTPAYGPGGIFSDPYERPDMFSAVLAPKTFLDALDIMPSNVTNEVTSILTAQTDNTGTNPETTCGTPATPGDLYKCSVVNRFGKLFLGSGVTDVSEIGEMDTFGVQPRQILNYARGDSPLVPEPLRNAKLNPLSESARRLMRVGQAVRIALGRIEVDGDNSLAYNATELGWLKEFDGLSRLIKDGYTDTSGETCPAADSLVEDWNAGTGDTVNGLTWAQALVDAYFSRQQLSRKVGMDGVVWVWVMDERLFRETVFQMACAYAYTRCGDATDAKPVVRQAAEVERLAIEMERGQFLMMGGIRVPVLFTTGAEVTEAEGGVLTGRAYLVPMQWNGAKLTYISYKPMNNSDINEFNQMGNTTARFTSNNGLYIMATRSSGFCDELLVASKMRLQVRTPFLGARFDGVEFSGYIGYRSALPGASSFYSGGTSYFNSPFVS